MEDGNNDHIQNLTDQNKEQDEGQGDCTAAEEEESVTEEKRDSCLDKDERETRSAVMHTGGRICLHGQETQEVRRGDHRW